MSSSVKRNEENNELDTMPKDVTKIKPKSKEANDYTIQNMYGKRKTGSTVEVNTADPNSSISTSNNQPLKALVFERAIEKKIICQPFVNTCICPELELQPAEITESVLKTGKKLVFEVVEAASLTAGRKILINPAGLVGGWRKAKDGIVYFGAAQTAGETVSRLLSENLGK